MTDAKRAGQRGIKAEPTLGPDRLLPKQPVKTAKHHAITGSDFFDVSRWAPKSAPELSVSACSALLRRGRREGWTDRSYYRVAAYFDYANPIAAGMWAGFAKGCR
jgi:hypothetical protein